MKPERLATIDIIRHAQKGVDGHLTDEGRSSATAFGQEIEDGRILKVYTSDIQRAIDTGNLIIDGSGSDYFPRVRGFLSEFPYTDERLSELNLDGGKWLFLNEGDEDLPSTKVIAGKLAKLILNEQKLTSRIDRPEDIHVVVITHVPTIMCFAGQVIMHEMDKTEIDQEVVVKLETAIGSKFIQTLKGFQILIPRKGCIMFNIGELSLNLENHFLENLQKAYDEWFEYTK